MRKTWNYNNVRSIHMELSSRCNAACPGCSRFIMNSPIVKPDLIQTDVTLEQFKSWFPVEFVSKIKKWQFCGSYGDPMACKDIYEILEYLCDNSKASIQINTNGGLGNKELYKKIGNLFADAPMGQRFVTFSVDGLKDTNHLYRRNVIWEKLWENMMAYLSTKAASHWDFLQFKHNVHQIEEARELASKYNMIFNLKNPFMMEKRAMPVYSKDLKLDYIIENAFDNGYEPYVPAPADYISPLPQKIEVEGTITCHSIKQTNMFFGVNTEIYVDAQGNIMPCCFVGSTVMNLMIDYAAQVQQILQTIGDKNNLNHHSLKEILNTGVLNVWSDSWADKSINICWITCGKNIEKATKMENLFVK